MKQWLAFLRNNREAIAAMDFFTLPTLTINNMDSLYWAADEKGLSLSSGIVGSREILYVDLKGDAKPCGNVVATDVLERHLPMDVIFRLIIGRRARTCG